MGSGGSIENAKGWKSQYDTMSRWYERCEKVHVDGCYTDFRDAVDFGISFFIASHSLKDWLKKTCPTYVPPRTYPECMKMCRDIANRAKHHALENYSREPHWSLVREHVQAWGQEEGARLLLHFDDLKSKPEDARIARFEFLSVIRDCKAFWDHTLKSQKLM